MTYLQVLQDLSSYNEWQQLEALSNLYMCNFDLNDQRLLTKVNNNQKAIDGEYGDIVIQCKYFQDDSSKGLKDYGYYDIRVLFPEKKIIFFTNQKKDLLLKQENVLDNITFDQLLSKWNKPKIQLKIYQQNFVNRHLQDITKNKKIIINCLCRFGKSYIMKYLQELFNWNVLVLTTKPTETISQYQDLDLKYLSIQKLKRNEYVFNEDVLFIDEPQESFMTELTETKLNLNNFKKVIFFTGTSQKIEEYLDNYVLCHYNFGDYILDESETKPKFPQIKFHLTYPPYETFKGITLVFNRDKTLQQLREMKTFQVQSSQDQSDLLQQKDGIYLLNQQFTTGITIKKCYQIVLQNQNFCEVDIQTIFRCFNDCDFDIVRNVYFSNKELLKNCLIYIYRQTGKQYITNQLLKPITQQLLLEDIQFDFDFLKLNIDHTIMKKMFSQFLKYKGRQRIINKNIQELIQSIKPQSQNERLIQNTIERIQNGEDIQEEYFILMQRLIVQLSLQSIKFDRKINKNNQDFEAIHFWNQLENYDRLSEIFCTFNNNEKYDNQDVQDYLIIIFSIYDKYNKSQIIKYIFELIESKDIEDKYEKLNQLFKTTEFEKKNNAEILTPQHIVIEMLDKFEELYPGKIKDVNFKIIEPCCGKGAFLIELYKRRGSLEGIYFNDINIINVQFCNLLFNTNIGTNLDALKIDYKDYDLVVTNPPYNLNGQYKQSSSNKQIFVDIIIKTLNSKNQIFLVPSKIFWQPSSLKYRIKFLDKTQFIKTYDGKQIFITVDPGEICYFINTQEKTDTLIKDGNILNKQIQFEQQFLGKQIQQNNQLLNEIIYLPETKFISSEQKKQLLLDNITQKPNDTYIRCWTSTKINQQQTLYILKNQIKKEYNYYKIITYSLWPKDKPLKFFICDDKEVFNKSFIGFQCKDKQHAEEMILWLNQNQDKFIRKTTCVNRICFENIIFE